MNNIKAVGSSLIFLLIGCCYQTAMAESYNRVVAIVNDDVITLHELNKKINTLTGVDPKDVGKGGDEYLQTRRKILEMLIDEKITEEKIKELGITVPPAQIDAAIERIKSENQWTHEDLLSGLQEKGITYEQYREEIKKDIERAKLINFEVKSKIIISDDKIQKYYENHKKEFESTGKVHLAGIFLLRKSRSDETADQKLHKKAEDILRRLRNGEKFAEMAKTYSEAPGADDGGDLGEFTMAQLEPELKKLLEQIPEGGFSDLIIRPNGIQIIHLIKKQEGKAKTLGEARDAIYRILYQEEVNKRFFSWIKELRKKSYTKVIF